MKHSRRASRCLLGGKKRGYAVWPCGGWWVGGGGECGGGGWVEVVSVGVVGGTGV